MYKLSATDSYSDIWKFRMRTANNRNQVLILAETATIRGSMRFALENRGNYMNSVCNDNCHRDSVCSWSHERSRISFLPFMRKNIDCLAAIAIVNCQRLP